MIFGFLNAVRKYTAREDLRQYEFSTIAWQAMNTSVSNYRRAKYLPRRRASILSLDVEYYSDATLTLADTIPDNINTEEIVFGRIATETLLSGFDRRERAVLSLLMGGADERQIAEDMGEDEETIVVRIENIRTKTRELIAA